MRKSSSLFTSAWLAITALLAISMVAITAAPPASAVGNASIYWIYSNGGAGNRIVQANEAATLTPTAITPATTAGYTARTLTSDGTYLYFVDNSNASLVRTDLNGGNRTVIATTSGVQQVAVQGGKVYYVEWNNGVYSVPVTGGTPTQLIAPSFITNTCSGASGGWGGIAVTSTDLFFSWFNGSPGNSACYGTYRSVRTGTSFGAPSILGAPGGGSWTTAGRLQLDGTDLYVSVASNSFDKTSDYSTWTNVSISSGGFSITALSVYGSNVYMTSNTGSVYTMAKTGGAITQLFTNAASSSGYEILAMAPPSYTITYQNGGGTGADLVQSIPQGSTFSVRSPAACPSSATDPCFTAPTGKRARDWELLSGTFATNAPFPSIGDTLTPTSNVVLKARWMGGPLTFSETSGSGASASVRMPNTAVGSTSVRTIYVRNSSSTASQSLGNISVSNVNGLIQNGGTCTTSTTLAALAECTIILNWQPSAAGTFANTTQISIQVAGGNYYDTVQVEGTAGNNRTVSFNANNGTGTMANQLAAFAENLHANAFTRLGYTFAYWTPFSDGSGTQYADGASWAFNNTSTQNFFANWTPDSHSVTYDSDGGSSVSSGTFVTDGTLTLAAAPAKSGFTFVGWFAAATGGTALTSPYSPGVISNITLYARWTAVPSSSEPQVHTVKFVGDDGVEISTGSYVAGTPIKLPAAPKKDGFIFAGWFTAPSGGVALTDSYVPSSPSNIAIYAQWIKVETPKPLPVKKTLSKSVYFGGDSALLTAAVKKALGALVAKAKPNGNLNRIIVTGWVQATKDTTNDKALSRARALAVLTELKKLGLQGIFSWKAAGVAIERTELARRVDIHISWTK